MPKLTKRFVDLVQPLEKDRFEWDDDVKGFGLRIKPSGVKSYLIQYRINNRSRRYTLGKHGVITPDEARKLAKQELARVLKGEDPANEKAEERKAPLIKDLASDYLERHAIPNKRPNSVRDDKAMLNKQILPKLGNMRVKDVSQRDLETMLHALKETPYQANRVRSLLSKMFSLSMNWGWRSDNPVSFIPKFQEEKRDRWLREDELSRLSAVLVDYPNKNPVNIIRLLLLTGARKNEVLSAKWGQFDFERQTWTKPSHTTKQKRTERIPISQAVIDLLIQMKEGQGVLNDDDFLFPSDGETGHIVCIKKAWAEIRTLAGFEDVRIHDLRHTFASHLVSSGMSLPIVGKLLGHTQPQTTQRYAHLADNPLREAAEMMSGKLKV
jgi:integrase